VFSIRASLGQKAKITHTQGIVAQAGRLLATQVVQVAHPRQRLQFQALGNAPTFGTLNLVSVTILFASPAAVGRRFLEIALKCLAAHEVGDGRAWNAI